MITTSADFRFMNLEFDSNEFEMCLEFGVNHSFVIEL